MPRSLLTPEERIKIQTLHHHAIQAYRSITELKDSIQLNKSIAEHINVPIETLRKDAFWYYQKASQYKEILDKDKILQAELD